MIPQILTRIGFAGPGQFAHLRRHVSLPHQRFADQHGVGAAGGHADDVWGCPDTALADQDPVSITALGFDPGREPFRRGEIGQGCATFFPRESTTQEIAELARQILTSPSATARRRLLRLAVAYEERLLELV